MKYLILLIVAVFPLAVLLLVYRKAKNNAQGVPETDYQVLLHFPDTKYWSFKDKTAILNFREIPSFPTADGKTVKSGMIYRSAVLNGLRNKDKDFLKELGITRICDVRSEYENEKQKDDVIEGIETVNIPVDRESGIVEINGYTTVFDRSKISEHMVKRYKKNALESAKGYGKALRLLTEDKPILYVSCYGKDRMGILIALLLDLLHVDRKTILADYSLSNLYSEDFFASFLKKDTVIKRMDIDPKEARLLFAADPKWLEAVFETIDTKFGNTENFLIQKGKMTKDEIDKIRDSLTSE